jgi:hypothetical protein
MLGFTDSGLSDAGGEASSPPAPVDQDDQPTMTQEDTKGRLVQYWAFRFTADKIKDGGEGLKEFLDKEYIPEFGFQKEKGKNGKRVIHYQGALECQPRKRFKQLETELKGKYPELIFDGRDYLNPSKSSAAERYALKEDTRVEGPWYKGARFEAIADETIYKIDITLYPWQRNVVDILDGPQDDRTIWWLWEPYGGAGKTTFLKWIYQNYSGVCISGGKAHDMKNGIVRFHEAKGYYPKIVIVNIPKSFDSQFISPNGFEDIKDMFFYSGKYGGKDENGEVCGRPPKMLVFANFRPDTNKMSKDRLKIRRLPDGKAKETVETDDETWD